MVGVVVVAVAVVVAVGVAVGVVVVAVAVGVVVVVAVGVVVVAVGVGVVYMNSDSEAEKAAESASTMLQRLGTNGFLWAQEIALRWIPVSESPPDFTKAEIDDPRLVLVMMSGREYVIQYRDGTYNKGHQDGFYSGGLCVNHLTTHWISLPVRPLPPALEGEE